MRGARIQLSGLAHPELPPTVTWALGEDARLVLQTVTDERGVFRIALPHHGPFTLIATAPDGQTTGRRFPVMAGDFVTTRLQPRSVFAGVAQHADGSPAAGAFVVEAPFQYHGTSLERHAQYVPPAAARADARGRFRLEITDADPEGLPYSPRSVDVWCGDARAPQRWYRIDGQSLPELVVPLQSVEALRGPIVAAGAPVPGARVLDLDAAREVARADARGSFAFVNSPLHALAMRAPGHGIAGYHSSGMAPCARLRARLLGPDGAATRRVALATRDREVHHHIAFLARTEADGTIDIDEARAGDPLYAFVEIDGRFVQFYAGVPSDRFHDLGEIRVGLGRTVAGTVLGADGLRIGAAMVMLQPVIAWENAAPPGNTNLPRVLTRVTYTDRAGRFRFDCVPRTQHRCLIAAGFAGMRLVPLAADGDVGTVQMDARTAVRGIACLPDGTRASAASLQYAVSLDGDGATFGTTYLVGRTDADGEFTFQDLPPRVGTGWAMAARDGEGFITTFAAGAPGGEATVRLAPHPGRL